MNKSIGIFAALTAFVVMLSSVMAQPPADGKGKGFGGGKGGPLTSKENFFTKYDTNTDKKVTKDEYMKVSTKDAEELWDKIAGAGGKDVDEAKVAKYIEDNPPFGAGGAFGGAKAGAGKMGKGGKGKGAAADKGA